MSKNTVKPGLTPRRAKRAKRVVENDAFDAFARRILRAYARRVAAGDIEALAGLSMLSSEVDGVLRQAVNGLRKANPPYSWDDIGKRLGVTRQAAQMRFGAKDDRLELDRRLIEPGLALTVAALVDVWIDHFPGTPATELCPGCGYRYQVGEFDCPSIATARPLLRRRHGQNPDEFARLTDALKAYLLKPKSVHPNRTTVRQPAALASCPDRGPDLFDLLGEDTTR
ncbi:hypothetical protein [Dactylosporangium sp. NPDC051541]|uniref:hypothetical protein n=1 Tax=Dactylosporangium sp. NPDC051541 TaxID=3363977 RepID=UPI0037AE0D6D